MNKILVDKSNYYAWHLNKVPEYWDMQRRYIRVEINRMKMKMETKIKLTT